MQCARAILLFVACPALQICSTLSHERHDFRKRVTEHKMCVLTYFSIFFSETFLFLRITERDLIKLYIVLHVKYLLFLSDNNRTWIFSTYFRKVLKYQFIWKSVQWEPICSMRTGTTNLVVAFRNFEKAPKS
jgi:hypothetical protein